MPTLTNDPNWYRQAVVYQIYPRSFADANGDGLGDLAGITSRVDHLATLGVDAVWLSPFYPSALADGGYDVDDYRNVDPRLGTLDDFDALVAALHERGIRVIVDIVPNHSGSGHVWFQDALRAGKGSPERDRYIFRDGLGDDQSKPPAEWTASFGGPAWEPVGDGQFYLHMFDVAQPDWNWDNPEVIDDFHTTLRFWSDRGVDGFRVDVANLMVKDLSEPLPTMAEMGSPNSIMGCDRLNDLPGVHDIYRGWREVFNEYDPPRMAVAEAWVPSERRPAYARPDELGQAFNFDLLLAPWDAAAFRQIAESNLALADQSGASTTWVLSNHDIVRHVTRYGLPIGAGEQEGMPGTAAAKAYVLSDGAAPEFDEELGRRRAAAGTMLILALPGSSYLYQGEELGLKEVIEIADDQRQDPTFFRSPGVDKGRDGCRVPLPWTPTGTSYGFGVGDQVAPAHLPQPEWFADFAVSVQDEDPSSMLNLYRKALGLRRGLLGDETVTFHDSGEGVLHVERPGGWHSVTNFTQAAADVPEVLAGAEVLLSSSSDEVSGEVPANTTVWFRA
ncbi:glycoside hydrolase family 13 protein [Aestuariimicrobium ganziense]|uniref:glycoside hydrolase family 13 protein n=1 Tax=Aestuariimicrobium ganziense TaxID=2773677 RepID=UPI002E2AAC84|nr:glycoside hydrolase family 13 protein [Aestuariimicrobium ganziense]